MRRHSTASPVPRLEPQPWPPNVDAERRPDSRLLAPPRRTRGTGSSSGQRPAGWSRRSYPKSRWVRGSENTRPPSAQRAGMPADASELSTARSIGPPASCRTAASPRSDKGSADSAPSTLPRSVVNEQKGRDDPECTEGVLRPFRYSGWLTRLRCLHRSRFHAPGPEAARNTRKNAVRRIGSEGPRAPNKAWPDSRLAGRGSTSQYARVQHRDGQADRASEQPQHDEDPTRQCEDLQGAAQGERG